MHHRVMPGQARHAWSTESCRVSPVRAYGATDQVVSRRVTKELFRDTGTTQPDLNCEKHLNLLSIMRFMPRTVGTQHVPLHRATTAVVHARRAGAPNQTPAMLQQAPLTPNNSNYKAVPLLHPMRCTRIQHLRPTFTSNPWPLGRNVLLHTEEANKKPCQTRAMSHALAACTGRHISFSCIPKPNAPVITACRKVH